MVLRRSIALVTGAPALLGLAACESSQTESARLQREGAKAAQVTKVRVGGRNPDVKVVGTTVLRSADTSAVVVALRVSGASDQVALPVQIQAKDARGKVAYRNDLDGLQPSLQQMALLRRGSTRYWVNDQVATGTPVRTASARVGRAQARHTGAVPRITLSKIRRESDVSGSYVSGVVRNESRVPQLNMPIYGVFRRGTRVVAAGRALIERLNPEPQKKPTIFRIFFVGKPKGAQLILDPEPTVLRAQGT